MSEVLLLWVSIVNRPIVISLFKGRLPLCSFVPTVIFLRNCPFFRVCTLWHSKLLKKFKPGCDFYGLRTGYSILPFGDLTLVFISFNRHRITYFLIHLWSNLCGCYYMFERNWSFIEFLRMYIVHTCLFGLRPLQRPFENLFCMLCS